MLNYQRDVLLMATKFGQQNGAYFYFVDRIKRNLRRPQLVFTERDEDLPENTRTVGRYYNQTHSFLSNVSLWFMLTFSRREVPVTHLQCKREAQENALCVPFVINSIATERSLSPLLH